MAGKTPSVAPIRIAISYRREDSKPHAIRLHETLGKQFGSENVFRDIDSIPLGGKWRAVIRSTVSESDVLLVLIGNQWLTIANASGRRLDDVSDVLRFELGLALKKKNVRVIPIQLEGTAMPGPDDLPEGLKDLPERQSHRIDWERWDSDIQKLTDELKRIQSAKAEALSKRAREAPGETAEVPGTEKGKAGPKTDQTKAEPAKPNRTAPKKPAPRKASQSKSKKTGMAAKRTGTRRRQLTPTEEWAKFRKKHRVGDVVEATVKATIGLLPEKRSESEKQSEIVTFPEAPRVRGALRLATLSDDEKAALHPSRPLRVRIDSYQKHINPTPVDFLLPPGFVIVTLVEIMPSSPPFYAYRRHLPPD